VHLARAACRTMRTILRLVVPRTIESSTSTTRLPSIRCRTGFSFSFTPKSRMAWLGSMRSARCSGCG